MDQQTQTRDGRGEAEPYDLVWDDFAAGFRHDGPHARWALSAAGELPAGDATAGVSAGVLSAQAAGRHPDSGEPSFTWSTGQEHDGGGGALDHLKWYATAAHTASSGLPGFDATQGRVLAFRTRMGGRGFGTEAHPFGRAVADPHDDLRLAAAAFSVLDFETLMVFDFFLTDRRVYAFYERLPQGPDTKYAAFSYALGVVERTGPEQRHDLEIRYDRSAGAVQWLVDAREVLRVERLGFRPEDRSGLLLDLGGLEEPTVPRQLAPSFGLFTLLDAKGPDGRGLVRLSDQSGLYLAPDSPEPVGQTFVDEDSRPGSRLWGQGARLEAEYLAVSSLPASGAG